FSVSGLNCTVTVRSSLIVRVKSASSSCSWARSILLGSGTGTSPWSLERQRFVYELKLLDGHGSVAGVEGGGLQLHRQATPDDESRPLGRPVGGEHHH